MSVSLRQSEEEKEYCIVNHFTVFFLKRVMCLILRSTLEGPSPGMFIERYSFLALGWVDWSMSMFLRIQGRRCRGKVSLFFIPK